MNILKEENFTKEIRANSMAISKNSYFGLFSGPCDIIVFNFEDKTRKRKSLDYKSDRINVCQWNKCSVDTFAITSIYECSIFNYDLSKILTLKDHTKHINSIDWHPTLPNQLISTSSQTVILWDTRQLSPLCHINSLGFQQVKWNPSNPNSFVTSMNTEIRLWDTRNVGATVKTINSAHFSTINYIEWHPLNDDQLISCGMDRKIKVWNISNETTEPVYHMEDNNGFAQCKFDFYGNLLTLSSSEACVDNQVSYWELPEFHKICHTLPSSNIVTSIEWKSYYKDSCQFISLHENFDFKIWQILGTSYSLPNRKRDTSSIITGTESSESYGQFLSPNVDQSNSSIGTNDSYLSAFRNNTMSNIMSHHSDPNLIMREKSIKSTFSDRDAKQLELERLINSTQVTFEKSIETECVIAHFTLTNVKCSVQFIYRPSFTEKVFLDVIVLHSRSDKIRPDYLEELEKILKLTAEDSLRNNMLPIENCVDTALEYLNKLTSRFSLRGIRFLKEQINPGSPFGNQIPFPKICGANFSPSGFLICFGSTPGFLNKFHGTYRSYTDMMKILNQNTNVNKNTLQKQLHKTSMRKLKSSDSSLETSTRKFSFQNNPKYGGLVWIFNSFKWTLFDRNLATNYCIDTSDLVELCQKNHEIVRIGSRLDLIEFWYFCENLVKGCQSTQKKFSCYIKPWASQEMGRNMCETWLKHFSKIYDIQNFSMFIMVMRAIDAEQEVVNDMFFTSQSSTIYKNISQESLMDNTISDGMMSTFYAKGGLFSDTASSITVLSGPAKFRTNSVSDNEIGSMSKINDMMDISYLYKEHSRLVDPKKHVFYNSMLLNYAHILSSQKLLNKSTKIIQKMMLPSYFSFFSNQDKFDVFFIRNWIDDHKCRPLYCDEMKLIMICSDCKQNVDFTVPDLFQKTSWICCICRLPVRGILSICSQCNHGGHYDHIVMWFNSSNQPSCPTGCGCLCISKDSNLDMMTQISVS